VNDDLKGAKDYPYAVWALVKQAAVIDKWLGIDYTQKFDINGTSHSMRAIVAKDLATLAKYTREGKMILGLTPEELLKLIPSDNPNRLLIADNWMREKVMPQAMLYTIWDKAR